MPMLGTRRVLASRVIQTFVTGVIGLLPVAITLAILAWLIVLLHDLVGPASAFGKILRSVGMTVSACEVLAYGIGFAGTIFMVFFLGTLVESGFGKTLHTALDGAMQRVPVIATVYDASKNLTNVFARKKDSVPGMTAVMCYFGPDRSIGIPALMPTQETVCIKGVVYQFVIIPTAPVPFGGALLCVRAEWVEPAPCGLDDLMGIYMSMGLSGPGLLNDAPSTNDHGTRP